MKIYKNKQERDKARYKRRWQKHKKNPAWMARTKEFLKKHRKRQVLALIELKEELGGKCQLCGYDKNYSALAFHHRNPKEKSFFVSEALRGSKRCKVRTQEEIRKEAQKCVLLCFNCHQELHHPELFKTISEK